MGEKLKGNGVGNKKITGQCSILPAGQGGKSSLEENFFCTEGLTGELAIKFKTKNCQILAPLWVLKISSWLGLS
jgi:hypothetical protein